MAQDTSQKLVETLFTFKRFVFSQIQKTKLLSPEKIIQFETLSFIKKQPQTKMKDLAKFFCITPPSVTSLIDKLEKQRLIIRNHDKKDRRNISLELTTAGETFLKTSQQLMHTEMLHLFKALTEKDKKNLINIYQKIYNQQEKNN